jgi:hypothetical protein
MALHRHLNQDVIDRLGNPGAKPDFPLEANGEEADSRTWTREAGLADAAGGPIDPGDTAGVGLYPVRATPAGVIYARRLSFDAAGGLMAVGPETAIAKAGSTVFQATETGVAPKGSAKPGEQDHFFTRTLLGMEARDDFVPDAETPVMRTNDDEDVELVGGDGED